MLESLFLDAQLQLLTLSLSDLLTSLAVVSTPWTFFIVNKIKTERVILARRKDDPFN